MSTADISATTTITFEQLTKYFHLPINDVAKELGICATMLKKICRKNGIPRWPHRKIKSLNKMIENLEASLQNNASEAEECIRQEINILKNKKSLIMKNPSILVQGSSNKRLPSDQEGKAAKKIRSSDGDELPVATITMPKSSISSSSNSLSINQLLTPSNPFSTPLTSYLLSNEEKDDKDSPRREEAGQLIARPPSPSNGYGKAPQPQQHLQPRYYLPTHPNMPPDYHCRTSVEFLTSAPHPYNSQQSPQTQQPVGQEHGYVLPKLHFTPNGAQAPPGTYSTPTGSPKYQASSPPSSSPKFRPPSPISSTHQQGYPTQADYRHAPAAHFFHHYHPQLSSPGSNGNFKMQYTQQPTPQPLQQVPTQSPPMVLRWVMEYNEKPAKK